MSCHVRMSDTVDISDVECEFPGSLPWGNGSRNADPKDAGEAISKVLLNDYDQDCR